MPTNEQMTEVTRQIESLESRRFAPENEWPRPTESDHGKGIAWGGLTETQKLDVLSSSVDWSGFDIGQQIDVSSRVIEAEPPEHWMDGIGADRAPVPVPADMERVVTEIERSWPANDNHPRGVDPPPGKHDFERQLNEAASQAKYQQQPDKDRSR